MTGKYDTLSPSDPLTAPEIIVIADGWRKSTFEKLLNEGNLEEIQDCILDNGVFIENVVSNIPSVSIASHASILTGSFQDEHRIPGHRWQSADCSCCRNLSVAPNDREKPDQRVSCLRPKIVNVSNAGAIRR